MYCNGRSSMQERASRARRGASEERAGGSESSKPFTFTCCSRWVYKITYAIKMTRNHRTKANYYISVHTSKCVSVDNVRKGYVNQKAIETLFMSDDWRVINKENGRIMTRYIPLKRKLASAGVISSRQWFTLEHRPQATGWTTGVVIFVKSRVKRRRLPDSAEWKILFPCCVHPQRNVNVVYSCGKVAISNDRIGGYEVL